MKLTLRGHHLLCLKGFQGYGYDDKFVENMTIINNLRKQPNTKIFLTDTADDICEKCPNLKNNLCENDIQNKNIVDMDREILINFNNEEYDSINLFKQVDLIFKNKKSINKICNNCKWHDKCLFYQNLD